MIVGELMDLSHMKCDLRKLNAETAAKTFHKFLCDVADYIGTGKPILRAPKSRTEAQEGWWVCWEDCPWPQWGITGGGWISGPYAGFCSMRNGAHYSSPQTHYGPFFTDVGESWYTETYYGFDLIFVTFDRNKPSVV
jgi:hypothetical protein